MSNPQSSDTALDSEPFEDAYRRHAPSAFRRARRLLGNDADAYEVVHDVFLSLLERPEQYAARSALATFLYAAVTHACLNRIRNRGTRLRLLRERFASGSLSRTPEQTPEAIVVLRSALARMPRPLAEVAVYYYVDGLTHEEIASVLGCSRRQVGNHMSLLSRWASKQELSSCRT